MLTCRYEQDLKSERGGSSCPLHQFLWQRQIQLTRREAGAISCFWIVAIIEQRITTDKDIWVHTHSPTFSCSFLELGWFGLVHWEARRGRYVGLLFRAKHIWKCKSLHSSVCTAEDPKQDSGLCLPSCELDKTCPSRSGRVKHEVHFRLLELDQCQISKEYN